MRQFAALVFAIVIASSTAAFAQPTTAPTSQPADSTTPQGTLKLLNRATAGGDGATIRKLMFVSTTQESRVADTLVNRTQTYAKFRAAAVKTFGEAGAAKVAGDDEKDNADAAIDQAEVKIDGDKAIVQMQGQPVNLLKVDGIWKLSLAGLTEGLPATEVDKMLDQMKMFIAVMSQTTDEVNQGKYKSADEVNDAIRAKLATVMMQAQEAATQPTTAP
ncbi:MAG TPA: hypothetical protein VKK61_02850 [Tepidisphaeraceae bacterium]|nr:hypothetical protein [Tepidisphaeraceae bacterium]